MIHPITKTACYALALMMLVSCTDGLRARFDRENNDLIDPSLNLSRDDYRKIARPEPHQKIVKAEVLPPKAPPLPNVNELLQMPRPPKIDKTQLVSIAVTDDVPLKDVLLELARLAEVDIELDSGIQGGISFIARDKPFNSVIERIAAMADLRYSMRNGVIRIERDLPYIQSYPLDFLNVVRNSTSDINISTNVLSAGGGGGGEQSGGGGDGGGGGGLNTGSTQSISATTEGDFWASLEGGLTQILSYQPASRVSTVSVFNASGNNISVMESGPATGGGAVAAPQGATTLPGGAFFVLNRQGGTLTISGTQKQHELVNTFVDRIRVSSSAQVLIEAKIVEVTLDDSYQSGIEWSAISDKIGIATDFNNVTSTGGIFTASLSDGLIDGFSGDLDGSTGADLNDFISLVEEFGTSRTLSSPRLHAMNNQQAVLTFAENLVYFQLNIQRENDQSAGLNQELLTIDSSVQTVPIGIIMTLQPSVNIESGEITLMVRPTLSRVTRFVEDPAVAFLATQGGTNNIQNLVPVVEVRELDSILKIKSGQVMIIGGLMEDSSVNNDRGIPGAAAIPWFGNLFKSVTKTDGKRELVIFIRATLVGNEGYVSPSDRIIYDKFTDDPRPLTF